MSRRTGCWVWDFRGHQTFPTTGVGVPWVKTDTSAAGAPTLTALAGGGVRMLLEATSEVQNLCLSFGDALSFDIDDLIRYWAIVKTAATLDSATSLAFGLASARNDAIDSIGEAAIFRCINDNNVVVETDDGTNNNDDVATGMTLKDSWKRFEIDFATGVSTREAPSLSLGRKSNVGFYGANDLGSLRRVASGTRFDMSNYTAGLQPFFQIQKTADTNADNLDILQVGVEFNLPQ